MAYQALRFWIASLPQTSFVALDETGLAILDEQYRARHVLLDCNGYPGLRVLVACFSQKNVPGTW